MKDYLVPCIYMGSAGKLVGLLACLGCALCGGPDRRAVNGFPGFRAHGETSTRERGGCLQIINLLGLAAMPGYCASWLWKADTSLPLSVCPETSGRIAEFSEHEAD